MSFRFTSVRFHFCFGAFSFFLEKFFPRKKKKSRVHLLFTFCSSKIFCSRFVPLLFFLQNESGTKQEHRVHLLFTFCSSKIFCSPFVHGLFFLQNESGTKGEQRGNESGTKGERFVHLLFFLKRTDSPESFNRGACDYRLVSPFNIPIITDSFFIASFISYIM